MRYLKIEIRKSSIGILLSLSLFLIMKNNDNEYEKKWF